MVIGPIIAGIKIGQKIYKYRKYIYRTLVAQDRAIGTTWKKGGYSKFTQAGVRHGALAGSIIGTIISNIAEDTPGNGFFQTPIRKPITTNQPYKTRFRSTVSRDSRRTTECYPHKYNRYASFGKRRRR